MVCLQTVQSRIRIGIYYELMSKAIRRQVVEQLWQITEKLNILYKDNWTALADREMVKFQTELFAQKTELDSFNSEEKPAKFVVTHADHEPILVTRDGDDWSFASSFLYSLTLITTVGKLGLFNITMN